MHSVGLNRGAEEFRMTHRKLAAAAMADDHPSLGSRMHKWAFVFGRQKTQYQDFFTIWAGSAFSQGGDSCLNWHDHSFVVLRTPRAPVTCHFFWLEIFRGGDAKSRRNVRASEQRVNYPILVQCGNEGSFWGMLSKNIPIPRSRRGIPTVPKNFRAGRAPSLCSGC
jgi:hypothetical protein